MKISRGWNSFYQSLPINQKKEVKFRLSAFVKADELSKDGFVTLWARVDNKDRTIGFFDNMFDRPITTKDWTYVILEGVIDENSKTLNFGGFCHGYGSFLYKNFELKIELEKDAFTNVDIKNSNFDEKGIDDLIPGWKEGTGEKDSQSIEEYNISSNHLTNKSESFLKIIGTRPINITEYTTRIGCLLESLTNVGVRMIRSIQGLSIDELDFIPNNETNSIGSSLMHLIATEVYYQKLSFENELLEDDEKKLWQIALNLGEGANKLYKNLSIGHYLALFKRTRNKTLELFKEKNDDWFGQKNYLLRETNYQTWLHVLEHQSYHFGQIVLLKKMIILEK